MHIKSAFETTDEISKNIPLLRVNEEGIPGEKIPVEFLAKNQQILWQSREKTLWFIILVCSIYFIIILGAI